MSRPETTPDESQRGHKPRGCTGSTARAGIRRGSAEAGRAVSPSRDHGWRTTRDGSSAGRSPRRPTDWRPARKRRPHRRPRSGSIASTSGNDRAHRRTDAFRSLRPQCFPTPWHVPQRVRFRPCLHGEGRRRHERARTPRPKRAGRPPTGMTPQISARRSQGSTGFQSSHRIN